MADVKTHTGSRRCGAVAVNIRTLIDIEPFSWTARRVDGRSF